MRAKSTNLTGNVVINILILIAGIIMIAGFRHPQFLDMLIRITGLLFLIPGVVNIIMLLSERDSEASNAGGFMTFVSWVGSAAAIVLGLIMAISPHSFVKFYTIVFGIALILAGLFCIYILAKGMRPATVPGWTYIIPSLVIVGGILALTVKGEAAVILITGLALVLLAISRFIGMIGQRSARKALDARNAPHDEETV